MQRKMHAFCEIFTVCGLFVFLCPHTAKSTVRAVFCTETNAEKVASYPSVLRETVTKD